MIASLRRTSIFAPEMLACSSSQNARCASPRWPNDQRVRLVEMPHRAVGSKRRGDLAEAAQHTRGTECRVQPVEMRHAVQHRQHLRLGGHRRSDRGDRVVQVERLAAQQHDIVVGREGIRGDRPHRPPDVAERTLDDQPGLLQPFRSRRAHQEGDVAPRLQHPPAEVAAGRAGSQDQNAHARLAAA